MERSAYPEPASSDAGFKMPKLMRSVFSQAESSPSDQVWFLRFRAGNGNMGSVEVEEA